MSRVWHARSMLIGYAAVSAAQLKLGFRTQARCFGALTQCSRATFGRLAFENKAIGWCSPATNRFSGRANRGTRELSGTTVVLLEWRLRWT